MNRKHNDGRLRNLQSIHFLNLFLASNVKQSKTAKQVTPTTSPVKRLGRRGTITAIPECDEVEENEELIDINNRRIVDSFITIHLFSKRHKEKLIYISDIQLETMNPEFDTISLPFDVPNSFDKIIIKLWSRPMFPIPNSNNNEWHLLAIYRLSLKANLIYLGEQQLLEEELLSLFKPNSMILKLNGRWYTLPNLLKIPRENLLSCLIPPTNHIQSIPSYSFDSIRSMNNLDRSIKEFYISKHKLSKQISHDMHVLQDSNNINNVPIFLGRLKSSCDALGIAITNQQSKNDEIRSEIYQIKKQISQTKEILSTKFEAIKETTLSQIEVYESEIESIKQSLQVSLYPELLSQLQSITKIIQDIFPIENIDGILFSILGFQFPSDIKDLLNICYYNSHDLKNSYYQPTFLNESQWHNFKIAQINAGITFIAQIISLLANITNTPLKSEIILAGSHSFIVDHVSNSYPLASATYPKLHIKSSYKFALCYNQYKIEKVTNTSHQGKYILMNQEFEYALKLLNRDLILLINHVTELCKRIYPGDVNLDNNNNEVPMECLDNFLWNLKYLMLFMTAPT